MTNPANLQQQTDSGLRRLLEYAVRVRDLNRDAMKRRDQRKTVLEKAT